MEHDEHQIHHIDQMIAHEELCDDDWVDHERRKVFQELGLVDL